MTSFYKSEITPNFDILFDTDGSLEKYKDIIAKRWNLFYKKLIELEESEIGGLDIFTSAYKIFGQNILKDGTIFCKEWCPGVKQLSIFGDYNFKRVEYKYENMGEGIWQLSIAPTIDNEPLIKHGSLLKLAIVKKSDNYQEDRISPWCRYANLNNDLILQQVFWNPSNPYKFKHERPLKKKSLKIYEVHIGISSSQFEISSYNNFTTNILPKIKYLGYNTIQLMAIMEHAYYASFGYQVTNFFAASSRYGTPDDLKELIDTAHGLDICVVLDLIHSHASANILDGLNYFDGSDSCYFKPGLDGIHSMWGDRLFNYENINVLRFLLSNLRWWVEEYHIDGFRFDGVSSMLYHDHSIGAKYFNYDYFYGEAVENDSLVYIMLANYMLHKFYPFICTIAEEWTGMPALTFPVENGGFGFDYRLQMGVPDEWIKQIKEMKTDYDLSMDNIIWSLTNRRISEKYIAYVESHDQALVGNQTMAFLLMGSSMYYNMGVDCRHWQVERGLALHKMIRLLTHSLVGEGYLNFTGNEFCHPEWLDFPRKGNLESFMYARRQWHLVDDQTLKFRFLFQYDAALNHLEDRCQWLAAKPAHVSRHHCTDMVIFFDRAECVFAFNFHPHNHYQDYQIGIPCKGSYKVVLDTNDKLFGGNLDNHDRQYNSIDLPFDGCSYHTFIDIAPGSGMVLARL